MVRETCLRLDADDEKAHGKCFVGVRYASRLREINKSTNKWISWMRLPWVNVFSKAPS